MTLGLQQIAQFHDLIEWHFSVSMRALLRERDTLSIGTLKPIIIKS